MPLSTLNAEVLEQPVWHILEEHYAQKVRICWWFPVQEISSCLQPGPRLSRPWHPPSGTLCQLTSMSWGTYYHSSGCARQTCSAWHLVENSNDYRKSGTPLLWLCSSSSLSFNRVKHLGIVANFIVIRVLNCFKCFKLYCTTVVHYSQPFFKAAQKPK